MTATQLKVMVALTGAWVVLGWGTAVWTQASGGGSPDIVVVDEAEPVAEPEAGSAAGQDGAGDAEPATTTQAVQKAPASPPAQAALKAAGCEPKSAEGARCRFIVAVQHGDPSILPDDDRETYEANAAWLESMRDFTWETGTDCFLEGDVTVICSSKATPPSSTDYDILDFVVQPVGTNLEHDDGATTGIEDYAVIGVSEFHQE